MTRLEDLQEQLEYLLNIPLKTGDQWEEICWLVRQIDYERRAEHDDHAQFGMGA